MKECRIRYKKISIDFNRVSRGLIKNSFIQYTLKGRRKKKNKNRELKNEWKTQIINLARAFYFAPRGSVCNPGNPATIYTM